MRNYLQLPDRNRFANLVAIEQLIIALGVSVVLLGFAGIEFAFSAAIAGAISALASWYTGRKIFNSRAKNTEEFVHNIFLAQSLKLILVLALFCTVFILIEINFLVFIATYALTLTAYAYELFKITRVGATMTR